MIDSLRPKLNSVPGIRAMLVNPPPINIGGRRARSLYQLTLQATDTDQLYEAADALEQQMRQLPGLTDVSSDLQLKNSELQIAIDRDRALTLGVSPRQIERTLYNYFGEPDGLDDLCPQRPVQRDHGGAAALQGRRRGPGEASISARTRAAWCP